MSHARPQISVVLLCYKAGERVRPTVDLLKKILSERNLSYELILVGNYNAADEGTDITPRVVAEVAASDPRLVPITEVKKGMFGWDVKSGLLRATGETVTFIDGDGQMPFEDIVRVYDALIEQNADYAQTYRVTRYDGMQRIFISRVYNTLLRILFPRMIIYDGNSKPKIFRREALQKLRLNSDNWFIDAEISIQVSYLRLKIVQIPTVFRKLEGRSSFVNFKAILHFLADLIAYRFRYRSPR